MMRCTVGIPHLGWLLLVVGLGGATSLRAQESRDSLVARAFNEFDAARRVPLLVAALDPRAGPPRGSWGVAVQLLAQTLIEEGQDSAAAVWLRWAIRLSPELQPDTIQFLPQVATAFRAAHEFVSRTRTAADTAAVTSWLWSAQGIPEGNGRIQVASAGLTAPLQVVVKDVGQLGPGAGVSAAPGSYEVRASATGYDSVRVTRELLPGVTTVLEFRLHATVALAPQAVAPAPAQPVVTPRRGKRFPWVWAALGAAGAGTAVAILAGGKPKPPPTGGIIISFPNPP